MFTHSDFSTDSIFLSFLLFVFVLGCVDLMSKLGFHTAVDVCVCFVFFCESKKVSLKRARSLKQPKRALTHKRTRNLQHVEFPGTQPEGHSLLNFRARSLTTLRGDFAVANRT